MVAVNTCPSVIAGCAMRVSRLEADGVPLPGANNLYTTSGMIELTFSEELERGADVTQRNACGDICATYKGPDLLKRVTLGIQICPWDPQLFELLRGGVVLTDGDAIGYGAPQIGTDPQPNGVSVEVWAKRLINGSPDPTWPYEWFAFPRCYFAFGERAVNDGAFTITRVEGYGIENDNWFDGPANDWPVASDRCYQSIASTSIPDTACGYATLPVS